MKRFWITLNMIYERIMLFVFILALLIVCYGLYDAWYVYHKADDNSLLKYKPTAKQTEVIDNPITEDMVGWITIDDTNVDYPIMQSDNNTEYLNKDPYGNYSAMGNLTRSTLTSCTYPLMPAQSCTATKAWQHSTNMPFNTIVRAGR